MTKEELLNMVKTQLQQVFESHEQQGMFAIYIWGSITRDDFDMATSDIDSLAIVDNNFPLELNEQIKEELTKAMPKQEWGFQIIYLDELNGGPLRSRVAKAMAPQTILPSFQDWFWVAGKQFKRSDFQLPDASLQERMKLDIEAIGRRKAGLSDPDEYKRERNRKGLVKTCLQLIYNRQLSRSSYFPLNYNVLLVRADSLEKPLLEKLLRIKNQKLYDEATFGAVVQEIDVFVAAIGT